KSSCMPSTTQRRAMPVVTRGSRRRLGWPARSNITSVAIPELQLAGEAIGSRGDLPRAVSEADLDHQLAIIGEPAAEGRAGIFGPGSLMWQIDREAAVFLGAGRALVLQRDHPWVAAANPPRH